MTTWSGSAGAALFEQASPPVDLADAERVARQLFGVPGTASLLPGERDRNVRIRADDGGQWVLKFVHPAEDVDWTAFQCQVLDRLQRQAPQLPVPRARRPLAGDARLVRWDAHGQQPQRSVRMYSFVPGTPMHLVPTGPGLRRAVGETAARLSIALHEVQHDGDVPEILWDVRSVHRVGGLLAATGEQRLAQPWLTHITSHLAQGLGGLATQLVHNDLHPQNLLVAAAAPAGSPQQPDPDRIVGIIDFGDLLRAPVVQELAVTAAYQLVAGPDPLAGATDVLRAFHRLRPLSEAELDLLFDLIVARLLLIVAITGWRASRHPQNSAYILRNRDYAMNRLADLQHLSCAAAGSYFRTSLEGMS